jgi:hypothetical protein
MLGRKATPSDVPKTAPIKNNREKRTAAVPETARFQDEIRLQAYYNYLWRVKNNFPGSEETDWIDAERTVALKMKAH